MTLCPAPRPDRLPPMEFRPVQAPRGSAGGSPAASPPAGPATPREFAPSAATATVPPGPVPAVPPGAAGAAVAAAEAAVVDGDPDAVPAPPRTEHRFGPLAGLAATFAALVLVALGFDAARLLAESFAVGLALGIVVAALMLLVLVAAGLVGYREWRAMLRLRSIEALQDEAATLIAGHGHGRAIGWLSRLRAFYARRTDVLAGLVRLDRAVHDAHGDREVVALTERTVLGPLDQAAYAVVVRNARNTALATALSPSAALDLAIVLWRNTRLIGEVARIYGARPGTIGSFRLARRLFAHLAVAGLAEGAQHAAADALGGSLAAAVSTRIGQGVINGLLAARIGLAAMALCRPAPFSAETRPSLSRVRLEVFKVPRQVL